MKLTLKHALVPAALVALAACTPKNEEAAQPTAAESAPDVESAETVEPATESGTASDLPVTADAPATTDAATPTADVATAPVEKVSLEQSLQAELQTADARILELETSLEQKGEQAREAVASDLADLRQKREQANEALGRLREAGADNWREREQPARTAFTELQAAVEKAQQSVQAH